MKQAAEQKVTKDTILGDIVKNFPQLIDTLTGFGVHCVGCSASPFETLEQGFKVHGMTDEQIADAVTKLNKVLIENPTVKEEIKEIENPELHLTDSAASKLKELMKKEKKAGLRIGVQRGGCAGFSYTMELDDAPEEGDHVFEANGVKVFVDKASMAQLNKANVDYVESLQGAGFKIENPNAQSSCGCGSSFK